MGFRYKFKRAKNSSIAVSVKLLPFVALLETGFFLRLMLEEGILVAQDCSLATLQYLMLIPHDVVSEEMRFSTWFANEEVSFTTTRVGHFFAEKAAIYVGQRFGTTKTDVTKCQSFSGKRPRKCDGPCSSLPVIRQCERNVFITMRASLWCFTLLIGGYSPWDVILANRYTAIRNRCNHF